VKIAHVREQQGPAGSPWRLAAALDGGEAPTRWLDLEMARQRAVAVDARLAHNSALHRQPLTTLDDTLARGLRVDTLRELVEPFEARTADDDAVLDAGGLAFGSPILRPPSLRDFYAFEGHVRTIWERRGSEVPETWYRLPIFYFSNVSEIRGPDDPIWAPAASSELDYELEVAAIIDTRAVDLVPERAEEAIGGYTIFNDWSARDLQREETVVRLGPAKGKDFASSFGPFVVTPDELVDARRGTGYDLAMIGQVNGVETSRGRWSDAKFSFGDMLARASADARLRPGDLVGSGTVGTGCLLEVKDATLGRYLQPGDAVELRIERLGHLRNPIVARPAKALRSSGIEGGNWLRFPREEARPGRVYEGRGLARGQAHLRRGHCDRRCDA
jgi:fumarylacetoacetate (FAA) hydrolase